MEICELQHGHTQVLLYKPIITNKKRKIHFQYVSIYLQQSTKLAAYNWMEPSHGNLFERQFEYDITNQVKQKNINWRETR